MKKIIFTIALLALVGMGTAQEVVKDQTEELMSIEKGMYMAYIATQDKGGKYLGGIQQDPYHVLEINTYRVAPNSRHKEVYLTNNQNYDVSNLEKYPMYLPDNEAFPVTYISNTYEGNAKLQESIGFTPRSEDYYKEVRAVFLDGKIYMISDWKSKDDYVLTQVLEPQEQKISGFKLMKTSMKSPKKMEADQPFAKLQAYLDAATKKQQEVYAVWIKDPVNKGLVDNKKDISTLMAKTIRSMSQDYLKSDEFKRIMANNKRAEDADRANRVTVQNNTGKDIYVYEEGSRNGSRVNVNSSGSFDCKKGLYYTFSSSSSVNGDGSKVYSANQNCGGTANVN